MLAFRAMLSASPSLPPALRQALTGSDCEAFCALVKFGLPHDDAAELLELTDPMSCCTGASVAASW